MQDDDIHLQTVADSTVTKIHAAAQYLLDLRPQSQVLLVGLLPRGDLTLPPEQHLAQPSKYIHSQSMLSLHYLDISLMLLTSRLCCWSLSVKQQGEIPSFRDILACDCPSALPPLLSASPSPLPQPPMFPHTPLPIHPATEGY